MDPPQARALALSLCVVLLALGCGTPTVDVPEAPDMAALLARYEHPSAPLTASTLQEVIARQQEVAAQIEGASGLALVLDALFAMTGGADGTSAALQGDEPSRWDTFSRELQVGALSIQGEGFLRLTRTCRGWKGGAQPDPADGSITLTATFTDTGFLPIVWGQVSACRELQDGQGLLVDGEVRLHTGGFLADAPDAVILLAFEGRSEVAGEAYEAALSLRAPVSGAWLEVDLGVSEGNVVFYATGAGEAGAEVTGFRAANGIWTCDWEAGRCERDGESLAL